MSDRRENGSRAAVSEEGGLTTHRLAECAGASQRQITGLENSRHGATQGAPGTPAGADPLQRASVRTKAIIIANGFARHHKGLEELRAMLVAFAPSLDEKRRVVRSVGEELRAAECSDKGILDLTNALLRNGKGAEELRASLPARDPHILGNRKACPADRKRSEDGATPEQGSLRFVAGGETAGSTAEGLRGLAGIRPPRKVDRQTVLVADDDLRARMIYRMGLRDAGFDVKEAENGIDAWSLIESGSIGCVVMDMKMPGYHGIQVLGRMVDSKIVLPVVVVSGFDQLASDFVVTTYSKLKFLTKPAAPGLVVEAVRAFLRPVAATET